MNVNPSCELCHQHPTSYRPTDADVVDVDCERCGRYQITGSAVAALRTETWAEQQWLLSCVTRNAQASGPPLLLTTDNIPHLIDAAPRPDSLVVVMDRLLLHFVQVHRRMGRMSGRVTVPQADHFLYYLPTFSDLIAAAHGLAELGLITDFGQNHVAFGTPGDPHSFYAELTVKGWSYAAELERSTVRSWQAFIAMSFAEELRPAFDQGIRPALVETGYVAVRVDRVQHNEKIDDRIIAELRRSGLVVADFTGHRGGVYFECGYAMGRGTPVIWCCHEQQINSAHFDTRQYNHITWAEPAELRERLVNRIRATLPVREPL